MAAKNPIDMLLALARVLRLCGGVDGVRLDACCASASRPAADDADLDGVCFRLAKAW